jgi:putative ABC transport system permease protein
MRIIKNGYRVSTVIDTVQDIKKIFFWIRAVMASLGLIAIFVASIGMFNTLTISLLERTREIGIMKALGVKRWDIGRLFITESLLMGWVGGALGVALAFFFQQLTLFALSLVASASAGTVPVIFYNSWYIVGGFILFALMIALVTGLYPARRATTINPIDAIRYE